MNWVATDTRRRPLRPKRRMWPDLEVRKLIEEDREAARTRRDALLTYAALAMSGKLGAPS